MKDCMKSRTNERRKISRRCFLGGAVGTMGVFTIVPRYVLGGAGQTPPSEKLNIAFVGAGGRARDNIDALRSENIAALCDVDDKRAAETHRDYPQARRYRDFRRMLEKERNIDAVVVSTPDHTHAVASMMAIELGKHVYCEKPLAHWIYEVRKLTEAAKVAGVARTRSHWENGTSTRSVLMGQTLRLRSMTSYRTLLLSAGKLQARSAYNPKAVKWSIVILF